MRRRIVIFACIVVIASLCRHSTAQSGTSQSTFSDIEFALKLKATLRGHQGQVFYAVFSPNGELVATADTETTRVWTTTGQFLSALEGAAPLFSRDGRALLTVTGKEAKLWDPLTGKHTVTLSRHERSITAASFSPDGRKVATGSGDGTVKLWDAATGLATATLWPVKKIPRYRIISRAVRVTNFVDVTFSPDLKFIVTRTLDVTRLWETATGELIEEFDHFVPVVGFSGDSKWLGLNLPEEKVALLNLETWKLQTTSGVETYFFNQIAFSPDGRTYVMASGSHDYHATLIDVSTGQVTTKIPLYSRWGADFISVYQKDGDALSFHPGSKFLLGATQNSVRMWNISTGRLAMETTEGRKPAAFNPHGTLLLTVSKDKKTVLLWELMPLRESKDGNTRFDFHGRVSTHGGRNWPVPFACGAQWV